MTAPRFGSVVTAMVTPFDSDGALDLDAAASLARHLADTGTEGIVVAGTTGEGPVLTDPERIDLFRAVVEAVTIPVVASSGTNDTAHSVLMTKEAADAGAAGVLVVTPYYNRPSAAGLSAHFRAVAAATTLPVVATSGSALAVAVDPGTTPRLFYVGETLGSGGNTGGLRVFNYSSLGTSALTQVSGSPFASGGLSPNYILPDASGDYVYVANGAGPSTAGNITGFTITASGTTYSVASTTSTAAGVLPLAMAEDSTGTFVFEVGSSGSPYFDAYTFDTTTAGQLESEVVSNTAASSIAIVAAP